LNFSVLFLLCLKLTAHRSKYKPERNILLLYLNEVCRIKNVIIGFIAAVELVHVNEKISASKLTVEQLETTIEKKSSDLENSTIRSRKDIVELALERDRVKSELDGVQGIL